MTQLNTQQQAGDWINLLPDAIALFDSSGYIVQTNSIFETFLKNIGLPQTSPLSCTAFEAHLSTLLLPESQFSQTNIQTHLQTTENIELTANKCLLVLDNPSRAFYKTVRFSQSVSDGIAGIIHLSDITKSYQIDQSKTAFLCTTAHELRAPMANIFGYSELLKNNLYPAGEQQKMLDVVYQETERMLKILNDLLDLAKIEAQHGVELDLNPQDINQLISDVLSSQKQMLAQHKLTFTSTTQHLIYCDKAKIEQVLINVLNNAVKYAPAGTSIELKLSSNEQNGIQIEITDQGIGMSASQIPRIFDRFYRGHPSHKTHGTGLGLSIVREIMNLHQGQITVNSQLEKGTQVILWFPSRPTQRI